MDLCGWMLPTVLGILAAALFVVLLTGRPRGPRTPRTVVLRGALLILLNLLVLALAGALLNNQYAFYSSWSDLAGGNQSAHTEHFGGGPDQTQVRLPAAGLETTVAQLPRLPQPGRRLQRFQVVGTSSHFANEVLVRLPAHYDPTARHKYPVIVALHGLPGSPNSFSRIDGFFDAIDSATRTKQMAAPIVVMPLINHPSTLDSECVDVPGGPQTETWLAHDIPQWVLAHFAVNTDRRAWATYGYSFGGWCAAMLAMRHPGVFGGAVVLQGYFRPEFDETFRPFRTGSAILAQYDLIDRARRDPPPVAIWVLASKQDTISYPTTREFVGAARSPMSVTAEILDHGGHRNGVWQGRVPASLSWLGRTMQGFRS